MANTYTKIYIQVVFAVSGRQSLIQRERKEELHKYITGIVQNRSQKLIAINCMPDHTHILIGLKPDMALSDLVRDVKAVASKFINERKWVKGKFSWQEGFGAFTYSHSQLDTLAWIPTQGVDLTKRTVNLRNSREINMNRLAN